MARKVVGKDKNPGRAKGTEKLIDLLLDPTKRVNEAEDILSTMVRNIFMEKGMSFSQVSSKTHHWLTNLYQGLPKTQTMLQKYSTEYSNFLKQIAQRKITSSVFTKFIGMLGAKRFKLTLTLYYDDDPDPAKARVEEFDITSTTANIKAGSLDDDKSSE